jgi:hypothetical protein
MKAGANPIAGRLSETDPTVSRAERLGCRHPEKCHCGGQKRSLTKAGFFLFEREATQTPFAHQEDKPQTGDYGYGDRKRETKLFHDAHNNAPQRKTPPPTPHGAPAARSFEAALGRSAQRSEPLWSPACHANLRLRVCLITGDGPHG